MNTRIEQLTRNYLDSLNLSYYLSDNQKQRIIEINSQSEWIIFNAGSLKAEPLRRGYTSAEHYSYQEWSTETYRINSSSLKRLLKEQIIICHRDQWEEDFEGATDINNIKVELFQFTGGSGEVNNRKQDAIPRKQENSARGNDGYWVAVNKTQIKNEFGTIWYDINNVDLPFNNSRSQWKVENSLDNLLNNSDMQNGTTASENEPTAEMSIDEYNQQIQVHAAVAGWDKLFEQGYLQEGDQWGPVIKEELRQVNVELAEKIEDKIYNSGAWQRSTLIKNGSSESRVKALKERNEGRIKARNIVIQLMKQLLHQAGIHEEEVVANPLPDDDNNQGENLNKVRQEAIAQIEQELSYEPRISDNELNEVNWRELINNGGELEIVNVKKEILTDIRKKRIDKQQREEKPEDQIINLLAQANQENNYEELADIISKIKKFLSTNSYQKYQTEIEQQEARLWELNPQKYGEDINKQLDEQLKDNGLEASVLIEREVKEAIDQAKKTGDPEKKKIAEEKIAQNGANNNLNNLLIQIKNKLQQKTLTVKEKKQLIKKVEEFIGKNNYQNRAYLKNKHQVDSLLAELQEERVSKNLGGLLTKKTVGVAALVVISLMIIVLIIQQVRKKVSRVN